MKYIFVAGAPGSKWSSVVKNIYYSPSVDQSDYQDRWTYWHDASGTTDLMHLGAYFDPGMELDIPEDITALDCSQLTAIFDAPFSGSGTRIIKSHIFCYQQNIDHLKKLFPESPMVLVYRDNDSCLGWWVKCGHFDITYPNYAHYYQNLREMSSIIAQQNHDLLAAWNSYSGETVQNNHHLCSVLGIELPPNEYHQTYQTNDIEVKVI